MSPELRQVAEEKLVEFVSFIKDNCPLMKDENELIESRKTEELNPSDSDWRVYVSSEHSEPCIPVNFYNLDRGDQKKVLRTLKFIRTPTNTTIVRSG